MREDEWTDLRSRMVDEQIADRGIKDRKLLVAMRAVPRHFFVSSEYAGEAYTDKPLPIGHNQTISQPYIVAFMTESLGLSSTDTVLEIGTGSGYQTAILAELVLRVDSVERVPELYESARQRLEALGYANIRVRLGDGNEGWGEEGSYDKIIVTAAAERKIPERLCHQLRDKGKMIIPVGNYEQNLVIAEKHNGRLIEKKVLPVRFVPLVNLKGG